MYEMTPIERVNYLNNQTLDLLNELFIDRLQTFRTTINEEKLKLEELTGEECVPIIEWREDLTINKLVKIIEPNITYTCLGILTATEYDELCSIDMSLGGCKCGMKDKKPFVEAIIAKRIK